MWSKFTDGSLNIEELKKRSNQLDDVLAELEQVKERLLEEKVRSRRISTDLEDTVKFVVCNRLNLFRYDYVVELQ